MSGFIITYSLERSGSVVKFWINRFYRLYPLYWVSLLAVLVVWSCGKLAMPSQFTLRPMHVFFINLSMLQGFVGVPDLLAVYWTLSLELSFYALCSILFAIGLLSKSLLLTWLAVLLK